MEVDLNCDLGEGSGSDAAIIPLISSANVACGFHAGSPAEALRTIVLAKKHGVVIGAHPGHADREYFGRRELPVEPTQIYADCVYQIGAMIALAQSQQQLLKYVKPHGGLYHQANRDGFYGEALIAAAELFGLIVMGLPGSRLEALAAGRCPFVAEGFADRRYQADGNLVSRDRPGAFIQDPDEGVRQVEWLLGERGVRTICVHGDNPQALRFVRALRDALLGNGFTIRPFA